MMVACDGITDEHWARNEAGDSLARLVSVSILSWPPTLPQSFGDVDRLSDPLVLQIDLPMGGASDLDPKWLRGRGDSS